MHRSRSGPRDVIACSGRYLWACPYLTIRRTQHAFVISEPVHAGVFGSRKGAAHWVCFDCLFSTILL